MNTIDQKLIDLAWKFGNDARAYGEPERPVPTYEEGRTLAKTIIHLENIAEQALHTEKELERTLTKRIDGVAAQMMAALIPVKSPTMTTAEMASFSYDLAEALATESAVRSAARTAKREAAYEKTKP